MTGMGLMVLALAGCQSVGPEELRAAPPTVESPLSSESVPQLTPEQEAFLDDLVTLTVQEVANIALVVYNIALANPLLTEAELDEQIIDAVALAAQSALAPSSLFDDAKKLMSESNYLELSLFAVSPFRSSTMLYSVNAANELRKTYFPGEGGRQDPPQREDAFRHVLGTVLAINNLYKLGQFTLPGAATFAATAGLAHECVGETPAITEHCRAHFYGPDYVNDLYFRNEVDMRAEMDLLNNDWAIQWALQNLPTLSPAERTTAQLAEIVEGFVRGPSASYNGIVSLRIFSTGAHPSYVIECHPVGATLDWCIVPIEEDLLNQRGVVYVLVEDLYGVLYEETILSFSQFDLSSAHGEKDHTPEENADNSYHLYELPPGTHVVEIVGLDQDDYVVFAFKQTFTLAAGESVRFDPSVDYGVTDPIFYDGPLDDCQRLQGVFNVEVNRLYASNPPPITVNPSTSSMYLNGQSLPLIDYSKRSNYPLEVEAATIRSCNIPEGEHLLGWDIDAGFFNPASAEGFYVFIDAWINNLDNNWPGAVWNRTDLTSNPTNCPALSIDSSFTSVDGTPRSPQEFIDTLPGSYETFFTSYETLYLWTSTAYDANNNPLIIDTGYWTPPYLDEKFTYNGVSQWVHLVTEWPPNACGESGPLQSQYAESSTQTVPLLTTVEPPQGEHTRPGLMDVRKPY